MIIELSINGQLHTVDVHPMTRLLDVLRDTLELPGTQDSCGEGACGSCTVLLDGEPVVSCLLPVGQCEGHEVETIEGLVASGEADDFLERFVALGGVQCGACTPGVVLTSWALLRREPEPGPGQVRDALAGNLCRCTGYGGILRAVAGDPTEEERS